MEENPEESEIEQSTERIEGKKESVIRMGN